MYFLKILPLKTYSKYKVTRSIFFFFNSRHMIEILGSHPDLLFRQYELIDSSELDLKYLLH